MADASVASTARGRSKRASRASRRRAASIDSSTAMARASEGCARRAKWRSPPADDAADPRVVNMRVLHATGA